MEFLAGAVFRLQLYLEAHKKNKKELRNEALCMPANDPRRLA
jgi:hypothetical protein